PAPALLPRRVGGARSGPRSTKGTCRMKVPFRTTADPTAADEARFVAGTRSLADLVAPESLTIHPRQLDVGGACVRVLFITGYPRTVGPGWLGPLIDLGEPLELS